MKTTDFIHALSRTFPSRTAGYDKDAIGLQVGGDADTELKNILVAYEITADVINEAHDAGANLIVAYHPLIFPNIQSVTDSSRTGMLVRRLIEEKIALYVLHTTFDSYSLGTTRLTANALGLINCRALAPLESRLEKIAVFVPQSAAESVREAMWNAGAGNIGNYDECSFSVEGIGTFRGNEHSNPILGSKHHRESVGEEKIEVIVEQWKSAAVMEAMLRAHPYEEVAYVRYSLLNVHPDYGMGTIGELPNEQTPNDFLDIIRSVFKIPVIRHSKVTKPSIRRIALLGGAGMEYYNVARSAGVDVFITGDIRYHDFYRAEYDDILLIDAGHAETERFVVSGMYHSVVDVYNAVDLHKDTTSSQIVESRTQPNAVWYHC